ncbi:MAG: KpsF/GutQ family sugar-phosphate isomerase [Deltaproteobacteria bacterium]|nr:KpsF/GutQ family sugar-phosphate isomerase [Deltaproteobacteria bacterium]
MNSLLEQAKEVLELEAQGILALIPRMNESFIDAVEAIFRCEGRVVVTGIGKSGIVGRKIVATLNSTGTPSLFLHPVEAMHGDLGMVSPHDILLAISNSGETEEIKDMLPCVKAIGAQIIAFTGNPRSTLAKESNVCIDVGVEREACPLGLAPTTSTTATLAMGDALCVALIKKRNFGKTDFQRFHPAGSLGQRLSIRVKQIMFTGDRIPIVRSGMRLMEAVLEIDRHNLGLVLVIDPNQELQGIITDGDLRRAMIRYRDFESLRVEDIMTADPIYIHENMLAVEALDLMEQKGITCLVITDGGKGLKGIVHLHDILGRGEFRLVNV